MGALVLLLISDVMAVAVLWISERHHQELNRRARQRETVARLEREHRAYLNRMVSIGDRRAGYPPAA